VNRKADARFENSRTGAWLSGAALFVTILLVYQPAWRAGFIWDDDVYVTNNPLLTAPDGLRRIWFSLDSPSQYFPLVYTSFYFERMLWGFHAAGYHAANIVLHAVNALVLWRLLKRLRIPGALIGAAIFALHPVQVESVAWITERKNVLMGLCFVLSLRAWTEFVDEKSKARWRFYAGALVFYALALAAKTTACTLPAALLVILWLKRMPIDRRRLGQIAPFVVLGGCMGLITIWWERYHIGTRGVAFSIGPVERLLIACRAIWFYLGKLVWPSNLAFSYARWNVSASDATAWFWVLLTVGAGTAIWVARKSIGRTLGLAAIFYVTTLAPVLGFIMLYTFRYAFVADHYQYLACIGPAALAGAAVMRAAHLWAGRARVIIAGGGALIAALGVLSWRQAGVYKTDEILWRETLEKNPRSWLACNNLGNDLLDRGDADGAMAQFRAALELEPRLAENYANLGNAFSQKGQVDDAIEQYNHALALDPSAAEVHFNLANALRQKGQTSEAIAHYRRAVELKPTYAEARSNLGYVLFQLKDLPAAIEQWQKAVELEPNNAGALNNLAWVLATCPIDRLRDGAKAVVLAQHASQLDSGNPVILRALAAAYAETGKFADAVKAAQSALALATAQGNTRLATSLDEQIKLHQAGLPFRDSSQAAP
jgi:tetratricopeptide (TPR) repeat protein